MPLSSAHETLRVAAEGLADRLRRIPDGETGLRADWIVWQYPVLRRNPDLEVGPPAVGFYRPLPRLKLRDGADGSTIAFDRLGYADVARASYREFALLKRDGVIPSGCRFQVSLPTPLAPISAFVALEDQAAVEDSYQAAMFVELDEIVAAIPTDQLAIQWDTNFEFGMLEGVFPAWFTDVRGGILERLVRNGRRVPADVELGFHFCYGDTEQGGHREVKSMRHLVDIANELSASLGRQLNWLHVPLAQAPSSPAFYAPLADLRLRPETELYLGILFAGDRSDAAFERAQSAHELVDTFGAATECGWGRRPPASVPELVDIHRRLSRPVAAPRARARFAWPAGFRRLPKQEWVNEPPDEFGMRYDRVNEHGWYKNLDPTVEQIASTLREGDVLIDYSGGTGILIDRLRLRIFDLQAGMVIVDSSAKFLRIALERLGKDERVAFRLLRYLKDERRLERLEEAFEPPLLERKVDALACTNAIHLYPDLGETLRSWANALRPGGKAFICSGNVRNPDAQRGEWIIDETVYVVTEIAQGLVRTEPRYAAYRDVLDDAERMRGHLAFRDRVFLAPRPLEFYTKELRAAGFAVGDTSRVTITADVGEWYEFLKTYHEAVLGWIGGTVKVEGRVPTEEALKDRLSLMRHALEVIFGGRPTFRCCWTYITATR